MSIFRSGIIADPDLPSKLDFSLPYIENSKRIIIVGGGLAGCCAGYFLNNSHDITIFEENSRVGGRVETKTIQESENIEFGAELIGTNHSLWLFLAKKLGLSMSLITPETYYKYQGCKYNLYLNDRKLTEEEEKQFFEDVKVFQQRVQKDCQKIDPKNPWNVADYVSVWEVIDSLNIQDYSKILISKQLEFDNLAPTSEQSYLALLCQVGGGSPNGDGISFWNMEQVFRCSNGNEELAKRLVKNVECKFKHKLIGFTKNNNQDNYAIFTTESGTILEPYDYCILTVPPNVYKNIRLDLPELPLGPATKTFHTYKSREWIENSLSPNALGINLGEVWESTENRPENLSMILTNFAPYYNEEEMKKVFPYTSTSTTIIDWNKRIGGGYSYIPVGKIHLIKQYQEYNKNNVFLAGEHTNQIFFGYMEGALQSGYEVVKKIININNI